MKHVLYSLLIVFLVSCQSQNQGQKQNQDHKNSQEAISYGRISLEQTKQILENEDKLTIYDVRTPEECAEGMLPNALELDFSSGAFAQALPDLDPNGTYLLYCRSGNRSGKALKMMQDAGFKKVYELDGGYMNWEQNQ